MLKYILKRVLVGIITLLIVLFLLFLLLKFMPGTPFTNPNLTAEERLVLETKYGLHDPFYIQFFNYFKGVITKFDFGISYVLQKQTPVSAMIAGRIGITVRIGLQSLVFGSLVGCVMGALAGMRKNSLLDMFTTVFAVIGISIPSYVFALGLAYYVGFEWKWLPITYSLTKPTISTILPTISLAIFVIAQVARFLRMELVEINDSDYIQLAHAKGLKKWEVTIKHALRNGLIPVVTVLGPMTVGLLSGSLVIEQVFGVPGVGSLLVEAINANDHNVVVAVAFLYSLMYIVINLVVDIMYGIIDPRIRVAGGNNG